MDDNLIPALAEAAFAIAYLENIWINGYVLAYEDGKLYEKHIDGTRIERNKHDNRKD